MKNKYNSKKVVRKQLKRSVVYTLYIIGIITCILIGQIFYFKKAEDKVVAEVDYKQESNINYRVFYRENQFYDEIFMPEGQTYVASLVDEIEIDFIHYTFFSNKMNGIYNYDVNARLVVWDTSNQEIWTKEYKLIDDRKVELNREKEYLVEQSVLLNFQEYKDIYLTYKNEHNLAIEAMLYVTLNLDSEVNYTDITDVNTQAKLVVEIPVSENTFNIEKVVEHPTNSQTISKTKANQADKLYYLIVSIVSWLMVLVLSLFLLITYNRDVKKQGVYTRTLKRILSTYDSIIVNVEKLPSVSGLNPIKVTSFEELVDAQNEVRLPINFKEDKERKIAKFVLVRNNLAWVYILKESEDSEE